MKCRNCNTEYEGGYCPNCGLKAETGQPQPAQYETKHYQNSNNKENKKPVYKKWWFWVLIVLAVGVIYSVGSTVNRFGTLEKASEYLAEASSIANNIGSPSKTETEAVTEEETEAVTEEETEAQTEQQTEKAKTFSEKSVYNKDGLKIYYIGFDNGIFSKELKFRVENNSGKKVTVSVDEMSIDGISVSGYMYAEVGDNKKKNDGIVLNSSDLDDNNIDSESIKKVDITFSIYRGSFLDKENPSCTINIQ